jgi:hypothetical protein
MCYLCSLTICDVYLQGYEKAINKSIQNPTCPECCAAFSFDTPYSVDERAQLEMLHGTEGSCRSCGKIGLLSVCLDCDLHFCSSCSARHCEGIRHTAVSSRSYSELCSKHGRQAYAYDTTHYEVQCIDCYQDNPCLLLTHFEAILLKEAPAICDELSRLKSASSHAAYNYAKWQKNQLMSTVLGEAYMTEAPLIKRQHLEAVAVCRDVTRSLDTKDYLMMYTLYLQYRGLKLLYSPQPSVQVDPSEASDCLYNIIRGSKSYVEYNFKTCTSTKKSIQSSETFSRWACYVVLDNGFILVSGGKPSKDQGAIKKTFMLDPVAGHTYDAPDMLHAHSSHIFIKVGHFVYALSGKNEQNVIHRACERLNLATLTWENIASITVGRTCSANCSVGDFIYSFGGYEATVENNVERYSISSNTWTLLSLLLPEKMWQSAAFTLNSHQVLIYGGESSVDDFQRNSFILDTTDLTFDDYASIPSHQSNLYFWINMLRRGDDLYMMNKAGVVHQYAIPTNLWHVIKPNQNN